MLKIFIPVKSLDWILAHNCSLAYCDNKWAYYCDNNTLVKVRKDVNDAYNKGYEKGFCKGFDRALDCAEGHYGEI